jgi:hypothetical protein
LVAVHRFTVSPQSQRPDRFDGPALRGLAIDPQLAAEIVPRAILHNRGEQLPDSPLS